jgi:hypothetical protein
VAQAMSCRDGGAPTPTQIPHFPIAGPLDFLPSVVALQGSCYALYEPLAKAVRGW